jgi:hypothetical protein
MVHFLRLFLLFAAWVVLPQVPGARASAAENVPQAGAQLLGSAANTYDVGSPVLTDLWVSPAGNDSNSGTSSGAPLKTLTAAWEKIPATMTVTGYRINLMSGAYPCEPDEPDNCQNYFSGRTGTYAYPIVIQSAAGPGTVTVRGGMNIADVSYLYLMNLTLDGGTPLPTNSSGNNLLHLDHVDHVLLRGMTLSGPSCAADTCNNLQEVLKANQAQHLYVENSVIGGAWHSAVDYFVVQYGHFINNEVHTAGQWCMYVKGGTSYLRVEGNDYHDCQMGFSAGQSGNFAVFRAPWLHYDVYDLKFFNNQLRDLPGVGMSVAGGYNVLLAHNTLYRVGTSAGNGYSLIDVVRAERGCNPTDELPDPLPSCQAFIADGGWGPNFVVDNQDVVPNRNVYIYNNVFYNPAPLRTLYTHFTLWGSIARPDGFVNFPNPVVTDDNLQIRGNLIWNGDASMPLGIEGTDACAATNPSCNETLLRSDNTLNTLEPQFEVSATGRLSPTGDWRSGITTYAIPDFGWDLPVPVGTTSNAMVSQADWQRVMNWAESTFPELFPAQGKQEMNIAPYQVRYYPGSDTYLGFNPADTRFYGYNPALFGADILSFGLLSEYLPAAQSAGF